jgi:hypothetical protein
LGLRFAGGWAFAQFAQVVAMTSQTMAASVLRAKFMRIPAAPGDDRGRYSVIGMGRFFS